MCSIGTFRSIERARIKLREMHERVIGSAREIKEHGLFGEIK